MRGDVVTVKGGCSKNYILKKNFLLPKTVGTFGEILPNYYYQFDIFKTTQTCKKFLK